MTAQTQQLMTSQIRSHIKYLTRTYNTLVPTFYTKLKKNLASMTVFNTI